MNPASSKQRSLDEYYPNSVPINNIKVTWIRDKMVPVSREKWENQLEREKRGIR